MKKYGILALTLIMAISLCACSRKDDNKHTAGSTPTVNTIPSATQMTEMTLPMTIPTIASNIPDPNVDPTSETLPSPSSMRAVG